MAYYGVVRGNTVELPDGEELADGTIVEVRVLPVQADPSHDEAEEAFKQRLLEKGLLSEIRRPILVPVGDRTPIEVEGTPLSEMIIEERR
jgi:hypothetical protein